MRLVAAPGESGQNVMYQEINGMYSLAEESLPSAPSTFALLRDSFALIGLGGLCEYSAAADAWFCNALLFG